MIGSRSPNQERKEVNAGSLAIGTEEGKKKNLGSSGMGNWNDNGMGMKKMGGFGKRFG